MMGPDYYGPTYIDSDLFDAYQYEYDDCCFREIVHLPSLSAPRVLNYSYSRAPTTDTASYRLIHLSHRQQRGSSEKP